MKKTTIIFLRHGEVENQKGILYGRLPGFGLSAKGVVQVMQTARILKKKKITAIYTSPLKRTRQTASIIGQELHLKPKISRLLIEVNLIFQGMPLDKYKNEIQTRLYTPEFIQKGQESITSISQRMFKFVDKAVKHHDGNIILAVSHGDPIMILKAHTLKTAFTWEYKRSNYLGLSQWLILQTDGEKFLWK